MGSCIQGESEAILGPFQKGIQIAVERLQVARTMATRLHEALDNCAAEQRAHAVWVSIQYHLRNLLSYDTRLHPSTVLQETLATHEQAVKLAVSHVAGQPLSEWNRWRMELPGPLGGFGLRTPLRAVDAMYVAAHVATAIDADTDAVTDADGDDSANDVSPLTLHIFLNCTLHFIL